MMISTSRRAIFLAGLKQGSTSIESALAPYFEIRLNETPFGKHMTYLDVRKRFRWLSRTYPLHSFFVFGVMRDPVDWMLSLYNSHCNERFQHQNLSTQTMSFDRFLAEWRPENSWQFRPQHEFMCDTRGLRADYVIKFERLAENLNEICKILDLPEIQLAVENSSPRILQRENLPKDQTEWIYREYETDRLIYERIAGKLLTAELISHELEQGRDSCKV